ncbi:hypothetical protein Pelo_13917 [Pelomyxa schiedti]|nr:hypothetical protein Pelo_13917 [Pelomyxa schiedti]
MASQDDIIAYRNKPHAMTLEVLLTKSFINEAKYIWALFLPFNNRVERAVHPVGRNRWPLKEPRTGSALPATASSKNSKRSLTLRTALQWKNTTSQAELCVIRTPFFQHNRHAHTNNPLSTRDSYLHYSRHFPL